MAALRKFPYLMTPPWRLKVRAEKSGLPTMAAMSGLMMSETRELTMLVKAARRLDR